MQSTAGHTPRFSRKGVLCAVLLLGSLAHLVLVVSPCFDSYITSTSPILTKNISKNTGRYKVQTLVQHDIRQAYKLELVSYNIKCPHYKTRFSDVFSRLVFHEKKQGNQKNSLQSSTSMVYKKSFLNISLFLATRFELCRGNFLYKMLWFLDVDIPSL